MREAQCDHRTNQQSVPLLDNWDVAKTGTCP